jgi:enoyl-CoA hydratase
METPAPHVSYKTIIIRHNDPICLITLNRPDVLNALNSELISELNSALEDYEARSSLKCAIITGSDKAFAAGVDVTEMRNLTFEDTFRGPFDHFLSQWDKVAAQKKPLIAAIAGYALGGGCELAMMCDLIIAADTARFGQPEIKLGIIPGSGGTQRLTRVIGKAKAMDLCLTGRLMDAQEALQCGLISRIVPQKDLLTVASEVALQIAQAPSLAVSILKESICAAYNTSLNEGLRLERRLFQSLFGTSDQKEGMAAFCEKRSPKF